MLQNITLSAEADMITSARTKASLENKSLNEVFRQWLAQYISSKKRGIKNYTDLMNQMKHIKAGKKVSREDMNER